MEYFNLQLHKHHIETFFESYYTILENRKTPAEKLDFVKFNLVMETQRYNRYMNDLNPEMYLDHKLYVDEVMNIILKLEEEKNTFEKLLNDTDVFTYKWEIEEEKLLLLYEKLRDHFISHNTSFETFTGLFSGVPLSKITGKIEWLKFAKNKKVNKKSITDLIDILYSKKLISKQSNLKRVDEVKILDTLFFSSKGNLKFTNSNFTTPNLQSEYRKEFEKIIESIL